MISLVLIKEIGGRIISILCFGTLITVSTIIFSKAPHISPKNKILHLYEEGLKENKYDNFRSDNLWKIIFELNKRSNPTPNNSELTKKLEEFKTKTEGWKEFKKFCTDSYSNDDSLENIEDFCADNLEIIKKAQKISLKKILEIKESSENYEDEDLKKLKNLNNVSLNEILSVWVEYCAKNNWGENNTNLSEKYCKFDWSSEEFSNLKAIN